MKSIVLSLFVVAFAAAFVSCGDTTDCYCTLDNGENTVYYDYTGDCSEIGVEELSKKMTLPGATPSGGCVDM